MVPVAAIYLCFYAGLGLLSPLFPLFLTDHGLSPHLATRVLAVGPLAAVLVPPAVGVFADAFRARAQVLRAAMLACTLAILALLRVPAGVAAIVVFSVVYMVVRAPLFTLIDAAAYATVERSGSSYGRLRVFGSVGFLVAAVVSGDVAERFGWDALLAATAVALALAFAACMRLPARAIHTRERVAIRWRPVLQQRALWWFLAVVAVSQIATAAYDACFALHLKQLGFGERFVGLAWAVGVLAEACVLVASTRLVQTWGAERLLAFSFATLAVRWLAVAMVTSGPAILATQVLHGITFPLYWVPAVMIVHRLAPRELGTSAQGLLAAAAGIGSVTGIAIAGEVLDAGGAASVFAYAAVAAAAATVGALRLAAAGDAGGARAVAARAVSTVDAGLADRA